MMLLLFPSEDFATAKPQSKVQFTRTITSSQDPGIGFGENQFALVLSPNQGSLYTGTFTFTSSEPIEIVVLHEIGKNDAKDQPTWSVDNNTFYAMSIIKPSEEAGSFDFTGAALAFRAKNAFTVTVSVDGWVRGQPTEIIEQKFEPKEKSFALPNSQISITIPMKTGFFNKGQVYYIITDSSNQTLANRITENQEWNVHFSPKLRWAPQSSQSTAYMFTNGVKGDGIFGFQGEVFSSSPSQTEMYSPLVSISTVSWKRGQNAEVLDSAEGILKAAKDGRINVVETNVTVNAPQISWPDGQMFVRNDTIHNEVFEKGQVLKIDKDGKKVTFVAHRGWGFDGRTVYYIIPDATPMGPADLMGVPTSQKLVNTLSGVIHTDMYQFKNGFKGPGELGFQSSIIDSKADEGYVPICSVSVVEWKDPSSADVLENISDINKKKAGNEIFVTLARPLSNDLVVNCPIIEPPN